MVGKAYRNEVEKKGLSLRINDTLKANIQKATQWLLNSRKQGLLLCGTVGNGKTTLANAIINVLNAYNETQQNGVWAEKITRTSAYDMQAKAREDKQEFKKLKDKLRLFIDDVGVEESGVKNYGNVICPFAELLFHRYDKNLLTIITTNLTIEQMEQKYDTRTADRIQEMFDRISFNEKSYRNSLF